ncbi:phosphonate C-P lyase system protein PhnL [Vibrio nigripulchritudo ATCC 27043]|uniref:phosphonate C-P lyase system protein PhnL n=1 Tax=Vibrio nigripulchritudo TaxID=28173 RepID=UPI00021C3799|nr:phosphonate C-P lyase system protein PhnL [Vibrio nigripulchritudo]EGU60764.1 phosphonate C-P lyase system protein PhnL [Vibrio nigripulchritudo ATCC 27043]BDU35553.1 phosphonate C-P lyase system protein PhnL [Vibrio nigripulchritudo]BDU41224.1 phosphonate C-P lyase system protein PhnL [Vibrio nigripulchritudo]
MLRVENISKSFVLHNQQGITLPVMNSVSFEVDQGECLVLHGESGSGKSTLLRALYANYIVNSGSIRVYSNEQWVDIANASPRQILQVRQHSLGWVSQFLRVIPRISALEVVMQPLLERGVDEEQAQQKAAAMLTRLNVPETLWHLAPATFSGGEQQRVNIARGFIVDAPILLLDEPTASLDEKNRDVVINLILEAKARGATIVGIFHDEYVRQRVADKFFDVKTATTYLNPQPCATLQ